jgi:hypothetical protein
MPPGLSEPDVRADMEEMAALNRTSAYLVCFAGAGSYDHEVPSATKRLTFRSEFVSARRLDGRERPSTSQETCAYLASDRRSP